MPVVFEQRSHQRNSRGCGYIRQSDQARVGHLLSEYDLAKVLVDRDENPLLRDGPFLQHLIARIRSTLARFGDIMTLPTQPIRHAATGAPVDKKFHCTSTESRESRAMTACAYARHARMSSRVRSG